MTTHPPKPKALFDTDIIGRAIPEAFKKLHPRKIVKNPVMFVVEIGSVITTISLISDLISENFKEALFSGQITFWLWVTILFANFAEAVAEGRGKAQADTLRKARKDTQARLRKPGGRTEVISSSQLKKGDIVVVSAGEIIPADGTVIEGAAAVDESAITGESAPVIRESGGDRSAVTGGTTVLSDSLVIEITVEPGKTFLDRMIALVEGAERQKTPNEIALSILLSGLTLIFLIAVVTLKPFAIFQSTLVSTVILVALLVCLIPTTIGGLLSAIGIAGMDRLLLRNVMAMSGRAVEAAGDVDVLLLDKTGTITIGNRMASDFFSVPGVNAKELMKMAVLASSFDLTPGGRSVLKLAAERGIKEAVPDNATPVPFTAETRMSGLDLESLSIRKGAMDAVVAWINGSNGDVNNEVQTLVQKIAKKGGTPLVVATKEKALGVIYLKDIVKPGIQDRFVRLRTMGIKTIMITGDNRLTAAAIAKEAGVDDFLAEAKPEDKLRLIRDLKKEGRMVAMSGDGTNDAPALAQSDVGLVMNTGTQAAREAGNMIDLDSDPTKLIEIVEIGKQLLITRGSLTTFSIANDVAKYFAILPAIFAASIPGFSVLNVMGLSSPQSAILSAVIFNAIIIILLVPLALRGVKYQPRSASQTLRYNLFIYGLGGILFPFGGIKAIDLLIHFLHLA
jgi:K+-transporting ATPase ATPase B chain